MQGSVAKYQGKQGVSWYYVIEAEPRASGKRRQIKRRGFPTKKAATEAMQKELHERRTGAYVERSTMTVGEMLTRWLETVARHKVKATTFEDYEGTIRIHLLPSLGRSSLQALTAADVQAFYAAKLASGASPRVVQLCHLRLSQALNQAVKWDLVAKNVAEFAEPPRSVPKSIRTFTRDEARAFLNAAADDGYTPLWPLALATGMRRGELLGLRWVDVDWESGRLHVRQSVVVLAGAAVIEEPKTKAARRAVPVPSETVEALRKHRIAWLEKRLLAGELWRDLDLIFCTQLGGPINPSNVDRNFHKIIERAGVPAIRFHDLRHTHATWLLNKGVPVKVVSERLGHAGIGITLDTYAHVLQDMQDAAAETIGALLFQTIA